jgi:hypothetical protein
MKSLKLGLKKVRAPLLLPIYLHLFHFCNTNDNWTVQDTTGYRWTMNKCGRILTQCVLGGTNETWHLMALGRGTGIVQVYRFVWQRHFRWMFWGLWHCAVLWGGYEHYGCTCFLIFRVIQTLWMGAVGTFCNRCSSITPHQLENTGTPQIMTKIFFRKFHFKLL